MTFQQYIEDIRTSLEDEIKKALEILKENLDKESEYYKVVFVMNQHYKRILQAEMKGLMAFEENNRERNKITVQILGLLDDLSESDFKSLSLSKHEKIENPVLVLVDNQDQKEEQESFFKIFNFSNVKVKLTSQINWEKDFEEIDVVIIDSRNTPDERNKNLSEKGKAAIREREALMQKLVDVSPNYYLIYFGNFLFWLNDNRDRCNAANSKFTLYNTTKQLIEFINAI